MPNKEVKFNAQDLKEVDGVLSKVAPHARIIPTAGRAARKTVEAEIERLSQPNSQFLHVGSIRQIDKTILLLSTNNHPSLSPEEAKNVIEALEDIREQQAEIEAEQKAQSKFERLSRKSKLNRLLSTAPIYAHVVFFGLAISSIVEANVQYSQAEAQLLNDPSYRLSKKYEGFAQRLNSSSSELSYRVNSNRADDPPNPRTAKSLIRNALYESEGLPIDKDRLIKLEGALPDVWNPTYGEAGLLAPKPILNKDEFSSQRVIAETARDEFTALSKREAEKIPGEFVQRKEEASNRFRGWLFGSLCILGSGIATAFATRRLKV